MLDRVGKEALVMLVSIALGFLLGGLAGAAICLALAAMIALVLWTPLRGWLGIPPHSSDKNMGLHEEEGDPPAFHTSHGGTTIVEGGKIRGYRRISGVFGDDSIARFINVKIRKKG